MKHILTIVIFLMASSPLHADTTWVAGEVYGTWRRDGNPYLVTDTLIVPLDSTLNIQPGVEIYFQDQQIRRTPIWVYGRLRAIGAEGDSIYFYSPVAGFRGIDNRDTPGSEIRLEYCVIDSIYGIIVSRFGLLVLKHCRNHGLNPNINGILCDFEDADTVQYCSLEEHYVRFMYGGTGVFQYNQGGEIWAIGQHMLPIMGNDLDILFLTNVGTVEICNNEAEYIGVSGSNLYCHDNHVGLLDINQSSFTIERNIMGSMNISESIGIVQMNEVGYTEIYRSSNVIFQKNLVVTGTTGMSLDMTCNNNTIQENTFVFDDKGIESTSGLGTNQVVNNIFVGDGVNSIGVYRLSSGNSFQIRYNDFYNVSAPTHNCELDTGNIFLDPCFRAGNPYDYQLQANSPCIDAGDPSSPLNPDSTRADIGCYFFDHRIDNPPALISPVVVNVQRGTTLRYMARATDDNGPLRFGFWDLPGWLHLVHEGGTDWMADSVVVSGRVPYAQSDFTFGVWVEDGLSQRDSQEVSVSVSPYTILAGEVTGVLTREQSPYMVVEDVVVPAGDSLRIEPGVEIRFQWDEDPDRRKSIEVRGRLDAVGTMNDSIRFIPESIGTYYGGWRGIWCLNPMDTTHISYAYLLNAGYGIWIDSGAVAQVLHSWIENSCFAGVHISGGSWVGIDSCSFWDTYAYGGYFLYGESASATVTNSYFEFPDTTEFMWPFEFRHGCNVSIHGCTFVNGTNSYFTQSSYGEFIGNRVINLYSGVGFSNGGSGIAANNIFLNGEGVIIGLADSVLVSNNVFFRNTFGMVISDAQQEVRVENNLFLSNGCAIKNLYGSEPFSNISYNNFFGNDSNLVNCQGDSTNIFVDPMVQDTIDFRLSFGSPCIDAGDPDPFFNDVDSTRNDIGCWGGPWGESYPYTPILSHQPKPIPTEFTLLPPYPNPFNSILVIPFTLPIETDVIINIYNVLGQRVHQFHLPNQPAGYQKITWNPISLSSGIYFVRLQTPTTIFSKKTLLLK